MCVSCVSGLERQLGSEAHDGTVRRRKYHLQLSLGRLQGDPRVHRWIYLLVDALERSQSDAQRRAVPQAHRGLGLVVKAKGRSTLVAAQL